MNREKPETVALAAVLLILLAVSACSLPIPADPQEHLKAARELEGTGDHRTAFRFYMAFATRYPDSKQAQDTLHKLYEIALRHFDKDISWAYKRLRILLADLPDCDLADEALRRVYQEAINRWDSSWGNDQLKKLVEDFPAAPLAAEATFKIGEYQSKYGEYEEAIVTLRSLVNSYPESERVEAAMFLTAEAYRAQYQGADYESMPLRHADEQYRRLTNQFSKGAFTERARERMRAIREELAKRDYRLALYYGRHGRHGSAKLYLDSVFRDYPDTQYGKKAQKMLQTMTEPEK
jgi:outer membrane assembly lipoprotein YfiO